MTYSIAACPVVYKGTCFRSKLEARWAAIFDVLDWADQDEHRRRYLYTWQYEPQGFLLPACGVEGCDKHPERPYLPDFYLPYLGLWVEVKGPASALDLTLMEWANHCLRGWKQGVCEEDRAEACQEGDGCTGLLLLGEPSQFHAPVVFQNEGVVCWDWEAARSVGFPYVPGGILCGFCQKDHIYSPALPPDPAIRVSADDLLAGVDLERFRGAGRRTPQMPDSFPEIAAGNVDFCSAGSEDKQRRPLVRLPPPPVMRSCLDRAEAVGRARNSAVHTAAGGWRPQDRAHLRAIKEPDRLELPVEGWRRLAEAEQRARAAAEREAHERATYERLARKYGGR